MNPALIILVLIGVVILWFLCSFLFIPLGKIVKRIISDAFNTMKKDDNNSSVIKEENENA